jgi:hypothetical protein
VESRPGTESELSRFELPVSGRLVWLRQPSGEEDLLIAETAGTSVGDATLALALASRLARAADGQPVDWGSLTVTDLDVLVLRLRQALIGDKVQADLPCRAPGCGQRIDIEFSIADFLVHQAPQASALGDGDWTLERDDDPDWYVLSPRPVAAAFDQADSSSEGASADLDWGPVRFRLPTADDLLSATANAADPTVLVRRCLRPSDVPGALLERVERVMEAMAPSLTSDLEGICPECRFTIAVQFDARWFCLRELRDRAASIYQDIDTLARRYHWAERDILAIPHGRRAAYAELARQAEGA